MSCIISVEPDNKNPRNISILFESESISLMLIEVAPVCETLFHIMYVDPGSPVVDVVFALKLKNAFD